MRGYSGSVMGGKCSSRKMSLRLNWRLFEIRPSLTSRGHYSYYGVRESKYEFGHETGAKVSEIKNHYEVDLATLRSDLYFHLQRSYGKTRVCMHVKL